MASVAILLRDLPGTKLDNEVMRTLKKYYVPGITPNSPISVSRGELLLEMKESSRYN